jgi:hypothetical protein
MRATSGNPQFIERIGRSFWFRGVVYGLPVLYAVRLILMVLTPHAYHMPTWRMVLWQGARDCSVVLMLFAAQRYAANYTMRRASLRMRRRDILVMALLSFLYFNLEMPSLLDLHWAPVALVSTTFCLMLYLWEMRFIKRLESETPHSLHQ